ASGIAPATAYALTLPFAAHHFATLVHLGAVWFGEHFLCQLQHLVCRRLGIAPFPMRGSDRGTPFLRKSAHNPVSCVSQVCRACATKIITELFKKFALRLVSACPNAPMSVLTF